ncbi:MULTISPECIES: hypothetical protein [Sphingomonas]|uniref:Uncharacterized protein n=1 Tax=Sphingomonas molluscorum TaxID=418184 RepID=A0ABU8Q7I5_9SPHN|nr:hypothetical protein [Sphingomonas sp. JUb134]MBM7407052.1 hypothetical protein [Sphingomonas sp. JUb134]
MPKKIDWQIDQPAQVNRGEFTSKRRVTLLSAAPRLYASVTLPKIVGEGRVLDWRAFVVDLDGVANKFPLSACERDQIGGDLKITVDGAGQQGHELHTKGWGSAGLKLRRGQFATVGEQLLILMSDVVADANGKATLRFKPYLRVIPLDNEPVAVRRPYAVVSMSDPKNGWAVDIGQQYDITFACEEAF